MSFVSLVQRIEFYLFIALFTSLLTELVPVLTAPLLSSGESAEWDRASSRAFSGRLWATRHASRRFFHDHEELNVTAGGYKRA